MRTGDREIWQLELEQGLRAVLVEIVAVGEYVML
jgi:hypothetical protein